MAKTSFPDKATPGASSATDLETYAYDRGGNMLTKATRRGSIDATGETISFTYDNLNRLLERVVPGSGGDNKYVFTYDKAGRRLTALHDGATLSYVYDKAGRMLSQTHNGTLAVSYAYDAGGNATKLTYTDGWAVDFTYACSPASRRPMTIMAPRGCWRVSLMTGCRGGNRLLMRMAQARPMATPLEPVIPPFLMGSISRTYAAIFSFIAGVIPPIPMLGRSLL